MFRGRSRSRQDWDWDGRVCVVTGASSGIGERVARDLAARRARVCLVARRRARLTALVEEIGGRGAGHSYVAADVSQRADVQALAAKVEAAYGRCDVLVNNAGISGRRPFDGVGALEDLQRVMATNFFGAVFCTAELVDLLEASAPSAVVNVASMAGRLTLGGASAYCASKFALVGWSEPLHHELAPRGVHVGLVEPGPLPTEGFPQRRLAGHPVLKHALTTDAAVSAAIRDVVEHRKLERVVPRWFYLIQVPRLLAPPLYRLGRRQVLGRPRGGA